MIIHDYKRNTSKNDKVEFLFGSKSLIKKSIRFIEKKQ
jgi:hypothetical protein